MSDSRMTDPLNELVKHSIDKTGGEITYSNTMSVRVGENEVILEFYFVLPGVSEEASSSTLLKRIVLPLKLGEQLSHMLSEGIAQVKTKPDSL